MWYVNNELLLKLSSNDEYTSVFDYVQVTIISARDIGLYILIMIKWHKYDDMIQIVKLKSDLHNCHDIGLKYSFGCLSCNS